MKQRSILVERLLDDEERFVVHVGRHEGNVLRVPAYALDMEALIHS